MSRVDVGKKSARASTQKRGEETNSPLGHREVGSFLDGNRGPISRVVELLDVVSLSSLGSEDDRVSIRACLGVEESEAVVMFRRQNEVLGSGCSLMRKEDRRIESVGFKRLSSTC